jgi:hypothetical protein
MFGAKVTENEDYAKRKNKILELEKSFNGIY